MGQSLAGARWVARIQDAAEASLRQQCLDFLSLDRLGRERQLHHVGLARFAEFLGQMVSCEANVCCVMRFFRAPNRVKFPDLSRAELAGVNLTGAMGIRANLCGANLRGCCLRQADLVFANFSSANLINADLSGATLNETQWSGAIVTGCQLGCGIGLTGEQRLLLKQQGARFDL